MALVWRYADVSGRSPNFGVDKILEQCARLHAGILSRMAHTQCSKICISHVACMSRGVTDPSVA